MKEIRMQKIAIYQATRYWELFEGSNEILDAGCGKGEFIEFMKEKGFDIIGIDIWPSHPSIIKCDVEREIPFPNNTFDAVMLSRVVEHLHDIFSALKNVHRILKPGGIVVIITPKPANSFWNSIDHVRPYTIESFKGYCNVFFDGYTFERAFVKPRKIMGIQAILTRLKFFQLYFWLLNINLPFVGMKEQVIILRKK